MNPFPKREVLSLFRMITIHIFRCTFGTLRIEDISKTAAIPKNRPPSKKRNRRLTEGERTEKTRTEQKITEQKGTEKEPTPRVLRPGAGSVLIYRRDYLRAYTDIESTANNEPAIQELHRKE